MELDKAALDRWITREDAPDPLDTEEPDAFVDSLLTETVNFYTAGTMLPVAHYLGDPITGRAGVEVAACSKCCALIGDDEEHANREQHAFVAHGLHATR